MAKVIHLGGPVPIGARSDTEVPDSRLLSGYLFNTLRAKLLALSKVASFSVGFRVGRNEEAITRCLDDIVRNNR
jgi:hypothetical protein